MNKMLNGSEAERLRKWLEDSRNIVLTCHVRPDGDAIGSTLGLAHLLKSMGKQADVVVPDQPPKSLEFLPGFKDICIYSRHAEYSARIVGEADLIICCDFNKPGRMDELAPVILGNNCKKVLVDHHLDPDDFCNLTFSYPGMSSTCELAFRLVAQMGLYNMLDKAAATCLLTGIVTDTRNFTVNCSNPDIYEVLEKLLEKGADKEKIVRNALLAQSLASLKLQSYALSEKLEVLHKCHGALITLDMDELKRFGYERGDTEGLVNMPLNVPGIYFSFFLREDEDCIKVSARSKDEFPVNKVCEALYGGGGHLQASGAEFHGSLEECRKILLENLPDYLEYLPSKPLPIN